jgi:hypothetical protein
MIRAIGPYQLVRRLGRGEMAEVHLAIARGASGFERHVAIKMLAPIRGTLRSARLSAFRDLGQPKPRFSNDKLYGLRRHFVAADEGVIRRRRP